MLEEQEEEPADPYLNSLEQQVGAEWEHCRDRMEAKSAWSERVPEAPWVVEEGG